MAEPSESLPLAFGSWELTPISPVSDVSFDFQSAEGQEFITWKLNLSGDSQTLEAEFMERGVFLKASQEALDAAPAQAMDFVRKVQEVSAVSFDAFPQTHLSSTEQDMLRMMNYLEHGPDEVSFGIADKEAGEIERSKQQFQEVMERMLQQLTHFAWVETLWEGRFLAHTVVNWGGAMQTLWGQALNPEDYQLHQRALHQALATRNILVHACLVTTQSAAKLAVLLTNPAGSILALPVAWKLVRQILEDIEKYRAVASA